MTEKTIEEFARDLLGLKECLRKKPVKIIMENGMLSEPCIKFTKKEEWMLGLTEESVDYGVLTHTD